MKSVFLLVLFSLLNYAALQTDDINFEDNAFEKPVRASNANMPNRSGDVDTTDLKPSIGGPCITPGGEQGKCVSMDDCHVLANLFANPINDIGSKEFLSKFVCTIATDHEGFWSLHVCCTPGWNSINYGNGLSDRRYCGLQHTDDYVYTGNTTSIDEFPWLAAIVGTYRALDKDEIVCHGSLINNRYILTTGYCASFSTVYGKFYKNLKVLLGEYHAGNTTDCVNHEEYGLECTEVQEFGIEEEILHPFYNSRYRSVSVFDIGLIRLNKTAFYTEYIRPICLPTQGTRFPLVGETLYTTGWGDEFIDKNAPVKKKVKTNLITSEECQKRYVALKVLSMYHICTLSSDNNSIYSCRHDRGVPVMYSYRNQWQIEGIILDELTCDTKDPALSTRVYPYIDWIKQTIRP